MHLVIFFVWGENFSQLFKKFSLFMDPLGQEPVTGRYPKSNEFRSYRRKIMI
jgi:hypothetical protein